jgi:hypothetical protein
MSIERDQNIAFDPQGTLRATTRWVSQHDEGLPEWLKNVRRAYQVDRANVADEHRVAVVLVQDATSSKPARLAVLDVGGATLEDVTRWSEWQSLTASHGSNGPAPAEEQTQGNGGKAYMYRLFTGTARILGVKDGKRNCKGFEGQPDSVDRGTPGFIPDAAAGREAPIGDVVHELDPALEPYGVTHAELPKSVWNTIRIRKAFTLVEGVAPSDVGPVWHGRIDADELVKRTLRNDQATLAIEQLKIYAIHNGQLLNDGKPLELEPIPPYPGFETPKAIEIPEKLPNRRGTMQSTTLDGTRPKGRLILRTSRENMYTSWKKLRPRWKVSYRTAHQMIGSKPVSELIPTTPGNYFVYATVELSALEPDYVTHGRLRPNDGPLMEAVDEFVAEKLRDLANEINARRRHDMDEEQLDEVHRENQDLDRWKNQFLSAELGDTGGPPPPPPPPPPEYGTEPFSIEITQGCQMLRVGQGVTVALPWFLKPVVRDKEGRPVKNQELVWISDQPTIASFPEQTEGILVARSKGICTVRVKVKGYAIESEPVTIEVWNVDHVLLTPRELDIPIGTRKQITAEVTDDEGKRATDVLLAWEHDADDPLIVRIRPTGWVTGNRLGRTTISAGAGDPKAGGVWARVRVQVKVVENPTANREGQGYPTLKVTGRDRDPETGDIRPGDPDAPALWQEPSDFTHNIWWLNLESSDAQFAFSQRDEQAQMWRLFHAQKVVEMVTQVFMRQEYTSRCEGEPPSTWAEHKAALERFQIQLVPQMWEKLRQYVLTGAGLE